MPRSRGSEMPQRQSPRGPSQLRTSSSDSDPLHHHRPITDRSPKVGDRRSPRGVGGAHAETVNQKKLGTRIADLESQLGQAQEELKNLKGQLASAEAAKKEAQQELQKKGQKRVVSKPVKHERQIECPEPDKTDGNLTPCEEISDENQRETDVFEVPMDPKVENNQPTDQEDVDDAGKLLNELPPPIADPKKPTLEELALKNDEISSLKSKLEEKEKEAEAFSQENENLKSQLNEANLEISTARGKEEEMSSRLSQLEKEVEESKATRAQLSEKLETVEGAKEALEAEMRKLRVQTEQWRKAADAAAAVLAGGAGMEMNGRRISERCGSMDKHIGSMFETPVGGYPGFVGSPGFVDDSDDGFGGGKRRGSGIRMFGDLWKKKSQK